MFLFKSEKPKCFPYILLKEANALSPMIFRVLLCPSPNYILFHRAESIGCTDLEIVPHLKHILDTHSRTQIAKTWFPGPARDPFSGDRLKSTVS